MTSSSTSNDLSKMNYGRPPPIPPRDELRTSTTTSTNDDIKLHPQSSSEQRNVSNGTTTSSNNSNTKCHRSSLRESISQKSSHLTAAEHEFLYDLCLNGNELEVQLAHDKLLDTDVFFPATHADTATNTNTNASTAANTVKNSMKSTMYDDSATSSSGWVSDTIKLNYDDDDTIKNNFHQSDSALLAFNLNDSESGEEFSNKSNNINNTNKAKPQHGSDRRLHRLQERRSSIAVHLWRAHESGLGISKQASRRSIFGRSVTTTTPQRRRSASTSSSSANGTIPDPDIFRPTVESTDTVKPSERNKTPIAPTATARTRRISWHSESMGPGIAVPAIPKMRPVVRRMRSESLGSRKSVTFHKDVLQPLLKTNNMSSVPAIPPMMLPRRSSSASSIPSLHYGVPISSPSSTTSSVTNRTISSIPSIRMAHSIRSISATSMFSDITETDASYSKDEDEKKSTDDDIMDNHLKSNEWKSSFVSDPKDGTVKNAVQLLQHTNNDLTTVTPLQLTGYTAAPSTSSDLLDVPPTISQQQQQSQERHHVLMRRASMNVYQGEGIEVTDVLSADDSELYLPAMADSLTIKSSNSFDDFNLQINATRASASRNIFRRLIRRSLSDDSIGIFRGKPLMGDNSNSIVATDVDSSWNTSRINVDDYDDDIEDDEDEDYYDSWKVVEDEYENGYGGGGTLPFRILGTSADDIDAHPHVLSPPLMESLQAFLPLEKSSDNFWMKYSLVRDGNTLYSFLQRARGSKYTILAIETVDGEVFGAFTAEPWRKSWNYYGTGESFLWRMRHSRHEKCHSIIDQAHMESEIDVYPFIGTNNCIQLCSNDKIAIGGGTYVSSPTFSDHSDMVHAESVGEIQDRYKAHEWGFGLTIESDFLHGTSSPCLTFGSPSLSTIHSDGSLFEIMNIELWTLTPCTRLEDAEKLELGQLFLQVHTKS